MVVPSIRTELAVGVALASTGFAHICGQSFILVAIAELFDKTWFVALLMAMNHPRTVVFWGCYLALVAHTIIAAGFGFLVAKTMPLSTLHFVAGVMYTGFACLYARDFYNADPSGDMIAAGKEEAGDALPTDATMYGAPDSAGASATLNVGGKANGSAEKPQAKWHRIFGQCFVAMFIAEWGDRTQIAMIGQHASQPLVPVCIGSLAAFFVLTGSAVMAGRVLADQKVSERFVYLISMLSFSTFAFLAFRDGAAGREVDMR